MKKLISLLALVSSIAVMAAMFTACGGEKKSSDNKGDLSSSESAADAEEDMDEEEDEEEDEDETEAKSQLLGTWESEDGSYTFNEDGTGTFDDKSFTYTEKNFGLSITFDGDDEATPFDYAVAGSKLIIKDAEQTEFVYEKK